MLLIGDHMLNWKSYTLNGVQFALVLDTKKHVWQVYFGVSKENPDLEFTNAKGQAVVEFLEILEKEIKK